MATTAMPVATGLILVLDNGIGASGQQLTRDRIYNEIKPSAVNDDIYAVAQALGNLQEKTVLAIQRRDIVEIQEGL
ncbi:DUF1659 domain-containing protein [Syntrophomonas erecta]